MTAPHSPGPLATEAGLLLDVLAERLSAAQHTVRPGGPDGPDAAGEHVTGGPVCTTGCPFCQVLAVVRGERPETAARLLDGALVVVRGLRALLDHTPEGHTPGHPAPNHHTPNHHTPDHHAPHPRSSDDPAHQAPPTPTSGAAPGRAAGHSPPATRTDSTGSSAAQARVEWIDVR